MPTPATTVRLEPELTAWVEAYAKQRGASKTQVIEAAVREFRALAAVGVPDLPKAKSSSPIRGSEQTPGASRAVPRSDGLPASARDPRVERQRKLNEAKYGRSR